MLGCQRWKSRREVPTEMGQKAQYRRIEETQTASELLYEASANLIIVYLYKIIYNTNMCMHTRTHIPKKSYIIKAYNDPTRIID